VIHVQRWIAAQIGSAHVATLLAAVGSLDFIDVSTMLRKEECAVGAGEGMREV